MVPGDEELEQRLAALHRRTRGSAQRRREVARAGAAPAPGARSRPPAPPVAGPSSEPSVGGAPFSPPVPACAGSRSPAPSVAGPSSCPEAGVVPDLFLCRRFDGRRF